MKGFGAEVVLMLPKLCQIGVGIKFLDKTFYRRALWHYFQLRRMGYSSKMAFGSSPIPFKYSNEATRRYFEKLWTEYAPHISGSGGLESDFKQKIIEQLRCLFLSGLEKYKFEPYNIYDLDSPGELRVYDSQGRVTGLVNGEVKEEIPTSAYDHESKTVLIFNSTDSYNCQVIGTNEGIYELTITSVEEGEATSFDATNIPTSTNTTHQYTVDWDALSQGEEGVTLQIDFDGDGVFEQTITADSELTHDEFALQTATTIDFDPDTLNLESEGKVVTVYIELPEGYNVSQIDVSSIRLNGTVPALVKPTEIGDYDSDGILDLMVKFDRASVIALFDGKTVPGNYMIEVTGTWAGIRFEGTVMIRVISPP